MTTLGPNQWMIALMFIAGLAACASNPSTEPHVFAFPAGCLDQNGRPNPDRVKCVFGARKNEIGEIYSRHARLYDRRLASQLMAGRTIGFGIHIAPDGLVRDVAIERNDTGDMALASDIAALIKTMNFGPFPHETRVRYGMHFTAN